MALVSTSDSLILPVSIKWLSFVLINGDISLFCLESHVELVLLKLIVTIFW